MQSIFTDIQFKIKPKRLPSCNRSKCTVFMRTSRKEVVREFEQKWTFLWWWSLKWLYNVVVYQWSVYTVLQSGVSVNSCQQADLPGSSMKHLHPHLRCISKTLSKISTRITLCFFISNKWCKGFIQHVKNKSIRNLWITYRKCKCSNQELHGINLCHFSRLGG